MLSCCAHTFYSKCASYKWHIQGHKLFKVHELFEEIWYVRFIQVRVYCTTFTLPKYLVNIQLLDINRVRLISYIIHLSHSIIYIIENTTLLQSLIPVRNRKGEKGWGLLSQIYTCPQCWTCKRDFLLPQATTQI